jgi:hypothetical protein
MTNLTDLTVSQLNHIVAIREKIEKLQGQLDSLVAGGEISSPSSGKAPKKRRMSAAGRARIAAAARARWARFRGAAPKKAAKPAKKKDRRMSPAVRAKLAEIARARWAKVRADGKKAL